MKQHMLYQGAGAGLCYTGFIVNKPLARRERR